MSSGEQLTTYTELAIVLDNLPLLLREERRKRRLSLRQAGEQIGVSFSVVRRFEEGSDCVLSNAVRILQWIDKGRL